MTRVCIVGNSHIGAVKQCLDDSLDYSDYDIHFWGVAGKSFPLIDYSEGSLLTSNAKYSKLVSGGLYENLPLNEFDVLYFYACHIEVSPIAIRLAKQLNKNDFFSSDFLDAYISEQLNNWWESLKISHILKNVRNDFFDKKIFLSTHPLWASSAAVDESIKANVEYFLNKVFDFVSSVCSELEIIFVKQPSFTFLNGFTDATYSKNSVKLATDGVKHDESDYVHMNAKYGCVMLRQFIEQMGCVK